MYLQLQGPKFSRNYMLEMGFYSLAVIPTIFHKRSTELQNTGMAGWYISSNTWKQTMTWEETIRRPKQTRKNRIPSKQEKIRILYETNKVVLAWDRPKLNTMEQRKCWSNIKIEITGQHKWIGIIPRCRTFFAKIFTENFKKDGHAQEIVAEKQTMEMGKWTRRRIQANETDVNQKPMPGRLSKR